MLKTQLSKVSANGQSRVHGKREPGTELDWLFLRWNESGGADGDGELEQMRN